jgi:hypothetical protein
MERVASVWPTRWDWETEHDWMKRAGRQPGAPLFFCVLAISARYCTARTTQALSLTFLTERIAGKRFRMQRAAPLTVAA